MMRYLFIFVLIGLAGSAMAQQPQESPATRGLILALQQMGVAAEHYVNEAKAQLAAKDVRIAELTQLCGDPSKAK